MKKAIIIFAVNSLLLLVLSGVAAAEMAQSKGEVIDPVAVRVVDYAFPDKHEITLTEYPDIASSLNQSKASPEMTGWNAGGTFHDLQHIGSMGRQIQWGSDPSCPWTVHLAWTYLPSPVLVDGEVVYNGWDGFSGSAVGSYEHFQSPGEYGRHVSLAVTDDNRFVVSCDNNQGAGFRIHTFWQFQCNVPFHSDNVRIDLAGNDCGGIYPSGSPESVVSWPKVAVQNPPDGDRVTHLIGAAYGALTGAANLNYYQLLGEGSSWTRLFGCAIDTIFSPEGYDLTANEDGTVAITWVANLPDNPSCDTCSQNTTMGSPERDRWDNDLYCQINRNYGRGTLGNPYDGMTNWWENRINLTKNVFGTDGYRPFADISSLVSSDGVYRTSWVAMVWDDSHPGTYQSRIFYWSEALGFDMSNVANMRTVATAQWNPVNCNPGPNNQNQNKVSITQCGSFGSEKLYVIWNEPNSPNTTGNTNRDDCSARAFSGNYVGAANGDLFISVSDDDGLTWDAPRGLTDTYGGPTGNPFGTCDPAGAAGPCPSEDWPSATPTGSDYPVILPSPDIVVTDIDPAYAGSDYFDLSFVDDQDPGGAVNGFGSWTANDVLWVRVPCVDPVAAPGFVITPDQFGYPDYVKHCEERYVDATIENIGNAHLTYSVTAIEDSGPYSGWLSYQNFSGSIPAGLSNTETGQIVLNSGAVVCGPGTVVHLSGRVRFDTNVPSTVDFDIDLYVVDTIYLPTWDTIATDCLYLAVNDIGGAGQNGAGEVNMDYIGTGMEWDPARADVYLYDASAVIGWIDGTDDTIVNYTMYNGSIADSNSLVPMGGSSEEMQSWAEIYHTGPFLSHDSGVGHQVNWYAPRDPAYDCGFVIKETKVYSYDGFTHNGIFIGDIVDFDVPADSTKSYNSSGFYTSPIMAVYLQGVEIPGWNDSLESANGGWDSDERHGALGWLAGYRYNSFDPDPVEEFMSPYGMYTAYSGKYINDHKTGVDERLVFENHSYSGIVTSDSIGDLHTGITYLHSYDLQPLDTLVFFTTYATTLNDVYPKNMSPSMLAPILQDALDFFDEYLRPAGQNYICGDADNSGHFDVSDMVYILDYLYLGGPEPSILAAADVDLFEMINVNDLVAIVEDLFTSYEVSCPTVSPPLWSVGVPNDSIYIHSFEASFPYADILPPEQTSFNVRVHLSTSEPLVTGCFPLSIRVGTDIPTIESVSVPNADLFNVQMDQANAVVDIDLMAPISSTQVLDSGSYELATITIEVPPLVGIWRPIYLEWATYPPIQNGQPTHQPWAAGPDFPPSEIWIPSLYRIPCIGIRGNIDGSEHEGTDISDVTFLVDYMFNNGWPPKVFEEADVNGTATLDITDLTGLVDYMWGTPSIPLEPCPAE